MRFGNFTIAATPVITEAYCKACGDYLHTVSDGFFSNVLFCNKCKAVFELKLVRVSDKKLSKEFIVQSEKEIENKSK